MNVTTTSKVCHLYKSFRSMQITSIRGDVMFPVPPTQKGFTLLEVIAILLILGIISAVAVSRMETDSGNLFATRDSLMAHLRLAQMRAMNTTADGDSVWGLRFAGNSQYHLFYCPAASSCDPANNARKVVAPGAAAADIDLSANQVTLSGIPFPFVLAFNRFGTPFGSAALTTPLGSSVTITLQASGTSGRITVAPLTGRISS